jgi:hypothetical protein
MLKGEQEDKTGVGFQVSVSAKRSSILRNLSLDGDRYKGGTVLDPEDGKCIRRKSGSKTASSWFAATRDFSTRRGPRSSFEKESELGTVNSNQTSAKAAAGDATKNRKQRRD